MELWDDSFEALGTTVDVIVRSRERPVAALASVRAWFWTVEAKLSRFRDDSLVCRLNRGEVIEDWMVAELATIGVTAWHATGGFVNPLVTAALETSGYDVSFGSWEGPRGVRRSQLVPSPAEAIEVAGSVVRLRKGKLDFGGLAKGWAVDRVAELLAEEGLDALVNAGGDLRAMGEESAGAGGWHVAIEAPDGRVAWEGAVKGAIATSTVLRRRWPTTDGDWGHHLIDPRTGMPSEGPLVQVSVAATSCLWAEVWSKAILIGGLDTFERARSNVVGVLAFDRDGKATRWGIFA